MRAMSPSTTSFQWKYRLGWVSNDVGSIAGLYQALYCLSLHIDMYYIACVTFLESVGAAVRAQRERRGWSRRALAATSGVSERFLAQLETGDGNISLRRFSEVAHSLGTTPAALLVTEQVVEKPIALLGVRGAGKST